MGRRWPQAGWVLAGAVAVVLGVAVGVGAGSPAPAPDAALVEELASLSDEARGLRSEVAGLEDEVAALRADADRQAAALAEAERRRDALAVLAAAVPAEGAGLALTVEDPTGAVPYGVLLDVVQELRDAGAEAVAVNGRRLGPASALAPAVAGVVLDGERLEPPYLVEAVGDPHALERGLTIPGGARDVLTAVDGVRVGVARLEQLRVPAAAGPDAATGRVR